MTIYVKFRTVTAAIAALSITGVTIKDVSQVPGNTNLAPKTLFPNAEGIVRGAVPTRETQGALGSERINLDYRLRYRYVHCSMNNLSAGDVVADVIDSVAAILVVLLAKDAVAGAVDLWITSMSDFPIVVQDPAGNNFWGCDFTLHVQEFCEVAP